MKIKPTFNKATLRVFALTITAVMCTLVILSAVFPFPEGSWNFLSIGTSQRAAYAQEVGEIVSRRTQQTKTYYLGGNAYATQGGLGPVHYQDNGWQEIDNAWVASSIQPWDYEMTKDSYHTYAFGLFNWGQIMKFERSGESVAFQPKDLQWTNALSQVETVSIPQGVNVSVSNQPVELLTGMNGSIGTLRWQGAYGNGRNFEWSATPGLLRTLLEINSTLPNPPQFIIDGGNPALRLSFIFAPSSNLDIYVNGQLWNKSSPVQTVDQIEFRKDSESLWYFYPAKYWASGINWTPNYIWTSPSSANGTNWINPSNARDSNTVTYAGISIPALQWSNYLTLSLNESRLCDRVRIWSDGGAQVNAIQVDVYYDGNWTNIYNGTLVKGSWQTYSIPSGNQTVSQARIRYWNSHASATRTAECHEFQFWAAELRPEKQGTATTILRSVGSDLWLDVLVPYKWIQTAVYPIYIDPDTGFHACGTAVNVAVEWMSDWVNPTYAQARDVTNLATNDIIELGYTAWLRCTNFGFSADIPANATIDGIIVRINRKASVAPVLQDSQLYLWNGSATIGANKASADYYPISLADKDYGAATDKWAATLTAALINSATFGVQLTSFNSNTAIGFLASVDVVEMCVYYTVAACSPSISLNTYSWNVNSGSPVDAGSNYVTGLTYFNVTNNSGGAVTITISGTDMTGGGYTWDLDDGGNPGNMIYALKAGLNGGDYTIIARETATYNTLKAGLANGASQLFGLKLWTPTVYADGNSKSGTITLTTVCD